MRRLRLRVSHAGADGAAGAAAAAQLTTQLAAMSLSQLQARARHVGIVGTLFIAMVASTSINIPGALGAAARAAQLTFC